MARGSHYLGGKRDGFLIELQIADTGHGAKVAGEARGRGTDGLPLQSKTRNGKSQGATMRITVSPLAGAILLALLTASTPASAQPAADDPPGTSLFAAGGWRDAGDLGDAGLFTAGIRRRISQPAAVVLSVSHSRMGAMVCPAEVGTSCVPRTVTRVTAADVGVEFLYGESRIQPYGVASVGIARLHQPDEDVTRTGASYSTGLGLSAPVVDRARIFGEARWRQETFGSIALRGLAAVLGLRVRI
jgi:hypothetical protein